MLLTNLGNALGRTGQGDGAAAAFEGALARHPGIVEARLGLANVRRVQRRYAEAAEHARAALAMAPGDPHLISLHAALLMSLGRTDETARLTGEGFARTPNLELASLHAHALNYLPGITARQVRAAHEAVGRLLATSNPRDVRPFTNSRDPDRRLRIGILSPDLRRHSVAFFLEPWLERFDRAALEVCCYPTSEEEDAVSARLRRLATAWHNVSGQDDGAIAQRIRSDAVDILIETAGLTQGHRLAVMSFRPAPVQVTMVGYPSTTGVAAIDARIVDSFTDPPGAELDCVESLVRIDPCFLCYRPPEEAPPVSPARDGDLITFGCFNAAPKINTPLLELWARVVSAVPGSRLVLKALDFDEPAVREGVLSRLVAAGVDASRVAILPSVPGLREHLARYAEVDIALDTFPYHGTTTTLEALWMGVPVVTLAGDRHASRVGVTLLANAGISDLIASSADRYVAIAAALAADAPRRAALRAGLRSRLEASPLCDAPAYALRLDAALRDLWRRWCARPS